MTGVLINTSQQEGDALAPAESFGSFPKKELGKALRNTEAKPQFSNLKSLSSNLSHHCHFERSEAEPRNLPTSCGPPQVYETILAASPI